MIKHIDYIANLIDIDYVGIGPDLLKNCQKEKHNTILGTQQLGGKPVKFNYPDGFSSIADIPNLHNVLLSNGYSSSDVNKILGKNLLRVFQKV